MTRTIRNELERFTIEREAGDGHYERVSLWSLVEQAQAEAVAAEQVRIRREIAVIRDDPALDGVMGLGWDAIDQIIGPKP